MRELYLHNREENLQDFYEVPHWMNISFVDCDKDSRYVIALSMIFAPSIN